MMIEEKHYDLGLMVVRPHCGEWLHDATKRLVKAAILSNCTAFMWFNDHIMTATPETRAIDLCKAYCKETC